FVEDAAHSIGSTLDGAPVGSLADLTTYSFFPTKNLTTAEGGAVVTADPELAARARAFKNHGLVRDRSLQRTPDEGPWHQEVHSFGLNYRLPDVLCALGTSQLTRLAQFVTRRAEIKQAYDEALGDLDEVEIPVAPEGAAPAWHLYPLRVPADRRRASFESLREQGIGVQVNYIPAYWHPVFEDLGYRRGMCPVAEDYYRREISLAMFPPLTDTSRARADQATPTGLWPCPRPPATVRCRTRPGSAGSGRSRTPRSRGRRRPGRSGRTRDRTDTAAAPGTRSRSPRRPGPGSARVRRPPAAPPRS